VSLDGGTIPGMFDPDQYYLFRRNELEERFEGWTILEARYQMFPAPEGTRKDFRPLSRRNRVKRTEEFFKRLESGFIVS
jgi:hypothetical protein